MKPPLLERLSRFLSPSWFFAGLAMGMALCIWAGNWAAHQNVYAARSRFFFKVSPEGYVYPTVENLCEFVRRRAPKDKILVLVGGSSISLGVGQLNENLWTKKLQEKLGPDFAVVNIAFRGCSFSSVSLPLAEMLSKEYARWYYVSDVSLAVEPSWLFTPGTATYPYRYFLWHSWLNGKLLPNPVRDAELKKAFFAGDEGVRLRAQEDALRGLWEIVANSSSLWNFIGDQYFFPAYFYRLPPQVPFWTPRKQLEDDESAEIPFPERMEKICDREKAFLRLLLHGSKNPDPSKRFSGLIPHKKHAEWIGDMVPDPALRRHILFLVNSRCPYFLQLLDEEERTKFVNSVLEDAKTLGDQGFHAIPLGIGYASEDYVDSSHFSNSAAPKMAEDVAAALLKMYQRDPNLKPVENDVIPGK